MKTNELEKISKKIKGKLIEISNQCRISHLGSSLSCVDILVACYWSAMKIDPSDPYDMNRDRLILSKGHAAPALYTTLAYKQFFDESLLMTIGKKESPLEEHPGLQCVPGVEAATGSLGHGLSIANGMAIASRIFNQHFQIFVVLGDGECNEGSVWEAAMFASKQQLDNIVTIIDFNKWQATGRSCEIMKLEPLYDKWKAFGWDCHEIDGHDLNALTRTMSSVSTKDGTPTVIIAHTVKGKGVSFMEDDNNWHYRIPNNDEVLRARQELGLV